MSDVTPASTVGPDAAAQVVFSERYSFLHRLHHWVHVALMVFFLFTGYEIFKMTFYIGDYSGSKDLHLYLGLFLGAWDLLFYVGIVLAVKGEHTLTQFGQRFVQAMQRDR